MVPRKLDCQTNLLSELIIFFGFITMSVRVPWTWPYKESGDGDSREDKSSLESWSIQLAQGRKWVEIGLLSLQTWHVTYNGWNSKFHISFIFIYFLVKMNLTCSCFLLGISARIQFFGEIQKKRFVIPVPYLNQPIFQDLLSQAEEQLGYDHPMGGLTIPCREESFMDVISCLS
jgi:SAUR family protein